MAKNIIQAYRTTLEQELTENTLSTEPTIPCGDTSTCILCQFHRNIDVMLKTHKKCEKMSASPESRKDLDHMEACRECISQEELERLHNRGLLNRLHRYPSYRQWGKGLPKIPPAALPIKELKNRKDAWLTNEEKIEVDNILATGNDDTINQYINTFPMEKQVDIKMYIRINKIEEEDKKIKPIFINQVNLTNKNLVKINKKLIEISKENKTKIMGDLYQEYMKNKPKINTPNTQNSVYKRIGNTLKTTKLPMRLDQPTKGDGNCGPEALLQQMKRLIIKTYLQVREIPIPADQQSLRTTIKEFAIRKAENTQQIKEYKENYELCHPEESWAELWQKLEQSGTWIDAHWIQLAAWYLMIDILIMAESATEEFPLITISGNYLNENTGSPGPNMLLGYNDGLHYQSLLPLDEDDSTTDVNNPTRIRENMEQDQMKPHPGRKTEKIGDNQENQENQELQNQNLENVTKNIQPNVLTDVDTDTETITEETIQLCINNITTLFAQNIEQNTKHELDDYPDYRTPEQTTYWSDDEEEGDNNQQEEERELTQPEEPVPAHQDEKADILSNPANKQTTPYPQPIHSGCSGCTCQGNTQRPREDTLVPNTHQHTTPIKFIDNLSYIQISLLGHQYTSLVDSGANISIIPQTILEDLIRTEQGHQIQWFKNIALKVQGCDKSPVKMSGIALFNEISMGNTKIEQPVAFYVMQKAHSIIMQGNWLTLFNGIISYMKPAELRFNMPSQPLIDKDTKRLLKKLTKNGGNANETNTNAGNTTLQQAEPENNDELTNDYDEDYEYGTDYNDSENDCLEDCLKDTAICYKFTMISQPKVKLGKGTISIKLKSKLQIRKNNVSTTMLPAEHNVTMQGWFTNGETQQLVTVNKREGIVKKHTTKSGKQGYALSIPNFKENVIVTPRHITIRRKRNQPKSINKIVIQTDSDAILKTTEEAIKNMEQSELKISEIMKKSEVPKKINERGFLQNIVTTRQYQDAHKIQDDHIGTLAEHGQMSIDYKRFEIKALEIPQVGKPAIHQETDALSIFLTFMMIQTSFQFWLYKLTKEQISHVLNKYVKHKYYRNTKNKMDRALARMNLPYLYQTAPLELVSQYHLVLINNYRNMSRIETSRLLTPEMNEALKYIEHKSVGHELALALLLTYNQLLVAELATQWGLHRTALKPNIKFEHQLKPIHPKELRKMCPQLRQQIKDSVLSKEQLDQLKMTRNYNNFIHHKNQQQQQISQMGKVNSTIIKKESELLDLIQPVSENHKTEHTSLQEAKRKNTETYERINKQVEATGRHPAQMDVARLINAEQFEKYLDYLKHPAATSDFFKQQTGQLMEDLIPMSEYKKKLVQAEWVHYNTKQEVMDDLIRTELHPQFELYLTLLKSPVMQSLSKRSGLPDFPKLEYFDHKSTRPSALYDPVLGIIKPEYAAFLTANMFTPENPINKYPVLFTQMAAQTWTIGNFVNSHHASSAGTFDPKGFTTRSLLNPTGGEAKPLTTNKAREIEDPDITDHINTMLFMGKLLETTAAPYHNTFRSIQKKRAAAKIIAFPANSPVLRHMLELQGLTSEQVLKEKKEFLENKVLLEQDICRITPEEDQALWDQINPNQPKPVENPKPKEQSKIEEILCTETKLSKATVNKVITRKPKPRETTISRQGTWLEWKDITSITIKLNNKEKEFKKQDEPNHFQQIKDNVYRYFQHIPQKKQQKKQRQRPFKITWGRKVTINYVPEPDMETNHEEQECFWMKNQPALMKTPEDAHLFKIITFCQEIGTRSGKLLKTPQHLQWKEISNDRKLREIPVLWTMAIPIQTQMETNNQTNNMLANIKQYDKLAKLLITKHYSNMVGSDDPAYDTIHGIAMEPLQDKANCTNLIKICTPFDRAMASIDLNLHSHHRKQVMLVAMEMANMLSEEDSVRQEKKQQDTMMSEEEELENTLGRTMVPQQADVERALLSYMGTTITNAIRLSYQTGPLMVQSTRTTVAKTFVKNISGTAENWEKQTIADTIQKLGFSTFLEKISTNQDIPVLVIEGRLHQSYKWQGRSGKARLNFHPTKATMVGTPNSKKQNDIAVFALDQNHTQMYQIHVNNNEHISAMLYKLETNTAIELTIRELIDRIKQIQQEKQQDEHSRYIPVVLEIIGLKTYKKRSACRIITNSRATNKFSQAVATYLQSNSEIQKILGEGHSYSGYDLTLCFYQMPCDALSGYLNTGVYRGREYVPLCSTMGAAQSCLYATQLNQTLATNLDDKLVLQTIKKPRKRDDTPLNKPTLKPMTNLETYHVNAPLGRPGNDALMQRIQLEFDEKREEFEDQHPFNLTKEERHQIIIQGNNHTLINTVEMIDDLVHVVTKKVEDLPITKGQEEQVILSIHLLMQKQFLLTMYQCSKRTETVFTPARINLRKSNFASKAIAFIGRVFTQGKEIVNWHDYKKRTSVLDTLPENGKELSSVISFLTYFSTCIPKLQYFAQPLREIVKDHPQLTRIDWKKYPEGALTYKGLIELSRQFSGMEVIPQDVSTIQSIIISSDASQFCLAYNVGITIKPTRKEEQLKLTKGSQPRAILKLVRNYSMIIQDNLKHSPISAKESIAALVAITREAPFLELLKNRKNIKKYILVDNSNVLNLAEKVSNDKSLAAHFYAHPRLKNYVCSLADICEEYDIQIMGVASQHQLADVMTRKVCNLTKVKTCTPCESCAEQGVIICQKQNAHANCPYGIESMTPGEPKLLNYKQQSEEVYLEGEMVQYNTGIHNFKDKNYARINLSNFRKAIGEDYQPVEIENYMQDEETQEQLKTVSTENNLVKYYRGENVKIKQLTEQLHKLKNQSRQGIPTESELMRKEKKKKTQNKKITDNPEIENITEQLQINQINWIRRPTLQQANQMRSHIQIYRPGPLSRRQNTVMYPHHPHVIMVQNESCHNELFESQPNHETTIVLFMDGKDKGGSSKNSFIKKIANHGIFNTQKKSMEATPYKYKGQKYIISTNPGIEVGTNTVKKSSLFPQIQKVFNCARQTYIIEGIKTNIVIIGELVEKVYQIVPHELTIAVILQQKNLKEFVNTVEIHSPENRSIRSAAIETEKPVFEHCLNFIANGVPTGAIDLHLNVQGQQENLKDLVKEKLKLRQNNITIQIMYPAGMTLMTSTMNLVTATAIHLSFVKVPIPSFVRKEINQIISKNQNPRKTIQEEWTERRKREQKLNDHEDWKPFSGIAENGVKALIDQNQDTKIRQIRDQIKNNNDLTFKTEKGQAEFKMDGDLVVGRQTQGDQHRTRFRPLIPEGSVQMQLLAIHEELDHGSEEDTKQRFKEQWFYMTPYTGERGLNRLAKEVINCFYCRVTKPQNLLKGTNLYADLQNIVINASGLTCAVWGHDVYYAKGQQLERLRKPQVSLLVCMGCGWINAETMPTGHGELLSAHIMRAINAAGYPPYLLVTDTAKNEKFGDMGRQIVGLNRIINDMNKKRIQQHEQKDKEDIEDCITDPQEENINNIGKARQDALKEYIQHTMGNKTGPLLRRPILLHQPTPYNSVHPRTASSLGTVDAACRNLKNYIDHHVMQEKTPCNQEQLERILSSFVYWHNHLKRSGKTNMIPAKIHFQPQRGDDQRQWMKELAGSPAQTEAIQLANWQHAAQMARTYLEVDTNRKIISEKDTERQKNKADTISKEEILEKYKPLTLLMIQPDEEDTKLAQKYAVTGPWVVLFPNLKAIGQIVMMQLQTGIIKTRNHRIVNKIIPHSELFSSPAMWDYLTTSRRMDITDRSNSRKMNPMEGLKYLQQIQVHLYMAYKFLEPILPKVDRNNTSEFYKPYEDKTIEEDTEHIEEESLPQTQKKDTEEKTVQFDIPNDPDETKVDPGPAGPATGLIEGPTLNNPEITKPISKTEYIEETFKPRRSTRKKHKPDIYEG